MTNTTPALTIDSLAAATIAFYITTANPYHLAAALIEFDDTTLADMTIDEVNENQDLFDIFIDADTNIDDITNPEFQFTDDFRAMITAAYSAARNS